MAFQRGNFHDFYKPSSPDSPILRERRSWLSTDPAKYLQLTPGAGLFLREAADLGLEQGTLPDSVRDLHSASPLARFLGEHWEPDYLILKRDETSARLVAGCVCFPSSWALQEKIGHPIEVIHEVVPKLNAEIGQNIATFLARLKPGIVWLRSNWGLSRSPELNQHPCQNRPRLDASVTLDETYFRVEEQSLTALPKTNGILFGIRLKIFALRDYRRTAEGERLANALETMPEPMAHYKGLSSSRGRIVQLLRGEDAIG